MFIAVNKTQFLFFAILNKMVFSLYEIIQIIKKYIEYTRRLKKGIIFQVSKSYLELGRGSCKKY